VNGEKMVKIIAITGKNNMSDTDRDTDERRRYDRKGRYRRGELLQGWINDTLERSFVYSRET
jgi:hypothetical protein